jgi:hypothetical protein
MLLRNQSVVRHNTLLPSLPPPPSPSPPPSRIFFLHLLKCSRSRLCSYEGGLPSSSGQISLPHKSPYSSPYSTSQSPKTSEASRVATQQSSTSVLTGFGSTSLRCCLLYYVFRTSLSGFTVGERNNKAARARGCISNSWSSVTAANHSCSLTAFM